MPKSNFDTHQQTRRSEKNGLVCGIVLTSDSAQVQCIDSDSRCILREVVDGHLVVDVLLQLFPYLAVLVFQPVAFQPDDAHAYQGGGDDEMRGSAPVRSVCLPRRSRILPYLQGCKRSRTDIQAILRSCLFPSELAYEPVLRIP